MFLTHLREERLIGTLNTYKLLEDLIWFDGTDLIVVPSGFVYNGGSVPRPLWWFIPPKGTNADRAFCLHDFLYGSKLYTKEKADVLMKHAMIADNFSPIRTEAAYTAVMLFGHKAWNRTTDKEAYVLRNWGEEHAATYEFQELRTCWLQSS